MSKMFTCHCCGGPAPADKQDPQRDKGFGTCSQCRTWLNSRGEDEWRKLEGKVRAGLKPNNQERWDGLELEVRRGFILQMIDEGVISWDFNNSVSEKIRRAEA